MPTAKHRRRSIYLPAVLALLLGLALLLAPNPALASHGVNESCQNTGDVSFGIGGRLVVSFYCGTQLRSTDGFTLVQLRLSEVPTGGGTANQIYPATAGQWQTVGSADTLAISIPSDPDHPYIGNIQHTLTQPTGISGVASNTYRVNLRIIHDGNDNYWLPQFDSEPVGGGDPDGGGGGNPQTSGSGGINDLMQTGSNVIGVALAFIGLVAVGFFIYGAWLYLSAGGVASRAEQGKQSMVNALIGMVLALVAFGVVELIMAQVVNPVTIPTIPNPNN